MFNMTTYTPAKTVEPAMHIECAAKFQDIIVQLFIIKCGVPA